MKRYIVQRYRAPEETRPSFLPSFLVVPPGHLIGLAPNQAEGRAVERVDGLPGVYRTTGTNHFKVGECVGLEDETARSMGGQVAEAPA